MKRSKVGEKSVTPQLVFGTGDRLSPSVSAYVVYRELPESVGFGPAVEPFGGPVPGEIEFFSHRANPLRPT